MKSKQPSKVKFATAGPSHHSQRIDRQPTRMFVQKQKSRMGREMLQHAPSSVGAHPTVQNQKSRMGHEMLQHAPSSVGPHPSVQKQKSRMGHEMLKHAPSFVGAHPTSQLERQMTRSKNQVQIVQPLYSDDTERLDFQVDASSNITHEPTDKQIRRQIQRWKTEYALSRTEEAPQYVHTKTLRPKHTKSFYDLRKAMVNRETVSLVNEQSTICIKPKSKDTSKEAVDEGLGLETSVQEERNLVGYSTKKLVRNESVKRIVNREEELKEYTKKSTFEFAISKEYPPGFNVASDSTEQKKECKNSVKKLNVREHELDFRNEIDEVLNLWKTGGFLKSIEAFVLSVPSTSNNSVSEIAQLIASPNSNYLVSLTNKHVCAQLARAYAIYCWIANNPTFNFTSDSILSYEKQYGFPLDDNEAEQSAAFKYCKLFVELALHANLEAEVVNGKVRTWKKLTDYDDDPTPHSWNVVSSYYIFMV